MRTLADIKKDIQIGKEQIRADEYMGIDGIPYCKKCNTARLHIMPDNIHALRGMCDCQYRAIQVAKERDRQVQMLMDYNKRKRLSGMAENFQDITFKNFVTTESNEKAFNKCVNYLNNSQTMRAENIGLYISGDNSTGKTFLAICLCNELLLQGWSCLYTTMADLLAQIDKTLRYVGLVDGSITKRIRTYDFVFIDDFGKEFLGREAEPSTVKAIEKQVQSIINSRYISQKPTIFTSNYSKNELGGELKLDKAIVERINEMGTRGISITGRSCREKQRNIKSEIAKRLGI